MEIRCKKTDCQFNAGTSCNRKEITIKKATTCGNYKQSTEKRQLINQGGNIFEASEELAPQNQKNVILGCRASCLYNKYGKCYANGITVIDGQRKAECATYIDK